MQRHTYYAHFPKMEHLYRACTAHYMERHPLPDPSPWAEIPDAEERMRRALSQVYAYYSSTEAMMSNVLRDGQLDPRGQESLVMLYQHWGRMRDPLVEVFGASGE